MDDSPFAFGSTEAPRKIEHDRWGRYINLPPIPGEAESRPWTRVTTLAGTLEDTYLLGELKVRQVIQGLHKSPELLNLIDSEGENDRQLLDAIASKAMKLANSKEGAKKGTSFHQLVNHFEYMDNHVPESTPEYELKMLGAYCNALNQYGLSAHYDYMERVVCAPKLGVVGRFDMLLWHAESDTLHVSDLKTDKTLDFGPIRRAVQLASYANAEWMLNPDEWVWEPMPDVCKSTGLTIWVPATQPGRAEILDVDLVQGLTWAQASAQTREWRRNAKHGFARRPFLA